jgi:hypothetical protein
MRRRITLLGAASRARVAGAGADTTTISIWLNFFPRPALELTASIVGVLEAPWQS